MSDELQNGVPGVPAGTEPGQPQPTAEEQPTPAAPVVDLSKINLDDLPQYRQVKSGYDRQIAESRKQTEEALRAARLATQQAQAVIDTVHGLDPEAAKGIAAQLAAKSIEAERDLYREQVGLMQWEQDTLAWGVANGLDVSSPDFHAALTSRNTNALSALQAQKIEAQRREDVKAEAQRLLQEMGYAPNVTAATPAAPTTPAKGNPILPPMGGTNVPSSNLDELYDRKALYQNEPTKYAKELAAVNQEIQTHQGR